MRKPAKPPKANKASLENWMQEESFSAHVDAYYDYHVEQTAKVLVEYAARKPSEIEAARLKAAQGLIKLRELTRTDLRALEVLATELSNHICWLRDDAHQNPEHYRKLVRKCDRWPAFVSVDKAFQKRQVEFARKLELGAAAQFNYEGKQASRKTPEVVVARRLIDYIQRQECWREKLPPLTRQTANVWWQHIRRERLLEKLGRRDDFENDPLFAKYKRTPRIEKAAAKKGLVFETWKRQQILTKLPQALNSLARKVQRPISSINGTQT